MSHRDSKPLTTLDGFVEQQRNAFGPAVNKLSAANRERALTSLALLEDVGGRTEALRSGLRCDRVAPAGSDALGPKLRDCDDTRDSGGSGTQAGHNSKGTSKQDEDPVEPKPAKSGAKARPGTTGGAVTPNGTASSPVPGLEPTTGVATTPSRTPTMPAPHGDEDEDEDGKGVLGGLLGDLF